jgi:hypothetical protein
MTHCTAFAVTSIRPSRGLEPETETIREAACEAAQTAISRTADLYAESISIGSNRYRRIQGNHLTNREFFGETGNAPGNINGCPPEMEFQVWAENGFKRDPAGAPEEVLRNNWNLADRLVQLALSNPGPRSEHNEREIFPDVLLTHDGTLLHATGFPDEDVFGDRYNMRETALPTASRYLENHEPSMAHHLALYPLRKLARAQFEIEYLRALVRYDGHMVVQLDWNQ